MTPQDVLHELGAFSGVLIKPSWGEAAVFYNPGSLLANGVYFATLKQKDGENDRASALDRPGVWRLSIGTPKPVFQDLFGPPPVRPSKGATIAGDWDFQATDQITPHPVYGWMGWIAVNAPTRATFERCRPLISAAHGKAVAAFEIKCRKIKHPTGA